ncbi:SagB family peptide dehydrogenase, partial [Mycobacterium kansasii]
MTRLSSAQLQALKSLNGGPASISKVSTAADESVVGALIDQLMANGWLAITVRDNGKDLYSILPVGRPPAQPEPPPTGSLALSKFAVLHRDADGFVLEH